MSASVSRQYSNKAQASVGGQEEASLLCSPYIYLLGSEIGRSQGLCSLLCAPPREWHYLEMWPCWSSCGLGGSV